MIRLRWIALAVLALPFAEFAAFAAVSGRFGFLPALFGVIATSVLGIIILKGGARLLFAQLATGRVVYVSEAAAKAGLSTAFAGLLLAIPGYITDILALLCLIPVLRQSLFGPRTDVSNDTRRPTPPGVVDLDREDWREEVRREGAAPRERLVRGPSPNSQASPGQG